MLLLLFSPPSNAPPPLRRARSFHTQTEEAEGGGGSVTAYQNYVRHELTEGTPARVQHVFERAVLDNCLSLELWQAYSRYLDFELRPAAEVTLAVHERAVRNLPWSAELWESYIRAAERAQTPLTQVEGWYKLHSDLCVGVQLMYGVNICSVFVLGGSLSSFKCHLFSLWICKIGK